MLILEKPRFWPRRCDLTIGEALDVVFGKWRCLRCSLR